MSVLLSICQTHWSFQGTSLYFIRFLFMVSLISVFVIIITTFLLVLDLFCSSFPSFLCLCHSSEIFTFLLCKYLVLLISLLTLFWLCLTNFDKVCFYFPLVHWVLKFLKTPSLTYGLSGSVLFRFQVFFKHLQKISLEDNFSVIFL
jgi:hypothetical protein